MGYAVQEATRASRGLAHRWALGAAVTAVVGNEVEVRVVEARRGGNALDRAVTRHLHPKSSIVHDC
jgi:hypothetical protein